MRVDGRDKEENKNLRMAVDKDSEIAVEEDALKIAVGPNNFHLIFTIYFNYLFLWFILYVNIYIQMYLLLY